MCLWTDHLPPHEALILGTIWPSAGKMSSLSPLALSAAGRQCSIVSSSGRKRVSGQPILIFLEGIGIHDRRIAWSRGNDVRP